MPPRERGRQGLPGWGGVVLLISAGVLVAGLVFLYLWQGAVLAQLRAERARALLELQEIERVRLDLSYQVDRTYSLGEIAARARALGMVPFDDKRTRYLVLDGGGH